MRTIGIDLGSNTLRAVEYDCHAAQFGRTFGAIVKTADGLAQTGRISEGAVDRVIEGLDRMRAELNFEGVQLRAVTTEAMRRAENAVEMLDHIAEQSRVAFEIIDGEEEARLTLKAVRHRLGVIDPDVQGESFVLIDIGGGSTELIFSYPDGTILSQSFPIGIVTLSQTYPDLEAIEAALPEVMRPVDVFAGRVYLEHGRPECFVATAGTPTSVASMHLGMEYDTYDPAKINGTTLTRSMPRYYLDALLSMPMPQRERTVGVGRADLVTAGILIFDYLYRILGFDACVVIDDGLREGVALSLCERTNGE
jgi:exopolyphosphatase/guanosine-5'-triphosphate,3'-diphosphate pyrophosphatase